MKIAWILLLSLVIVFLLDECEGWGYRAPRIRIGVPRIRIGVPRVRFGIPRIQGRRLIRNFSRFVSSSIKTLKKIVIITNPHLFIAKKIYDRYKKEKLIELLTGQPCKSDVLCGGSCDANKCVWHCDNMCKIFPGNEEIIWPGQIAALPCKFQKYDNSDVGYFEDYDLARQLSVRRQDRTNMKVFRRLDQNGDGKVTPREFSNTKKYLIIDQDTC